MGRIRKALGVIEEYKKAEDLNGVDRTPTTLLSTKWEPPRGN